MTRFLRALALMFACTAAWAVVPERPAAPGADPSALPASAGAAPSTPEMPNAPAAALPANGPPAAPSGAGQRIYERSRQHLVQVRTLLKTQDSQSSVGSGFLVSDDGLIVSNFHVVSQFALQPARHRLVYATVDGRQGPLQLLAFDVVNDLALLRPVDPAPLAGRGAVPLRPADEPLPRGARIYSLGNPLDVGFAVAEGSYNGPVERSFIEQLFFGGSLSAGMSGGPALDEQGRLVGVNVAARRDGEQVSFLVPAAPLRGLIARGSQAAPIAAPAWAEITRQLQAHESALTQAFLALPWRDAGDPRYRIPVPQERFVRCWGSGSPQTARGLQFERGMCRMDSRIFIDGSLYTGHLSVQHESYDGSRLGPLRFAQRFSDSFANEDMGRNQPQRTAPRCVERNVDREGLPLRTVVCLRAYTRLEGLHDLSVLVASLDGTRTGVLGRFDAYGVSLPSAQRLTAHYLNGFAWTTPPTPASR